MSLPYLKDKTLLDLKSQIQPNLEAYRTGNFSFLAEDSSLTRELDIECDLQVELKDPKTATELYEPENCLAVYEALKNLTPYDARDERIWAYLSHVTFLDHSRKRWPIPADDVQAIKHIRTHFFATTSRQIERDHSISRLWWIAHLCSRVQGLTHDECLRVLLFRSDVRAGIIERPTMSQSQNLFSVMLHGLNDSMKDDQSLFERQKFRKVIGDLNSIGGFKLLDVLPKAELQKIFTRVVEAA